MYQLTFFVPESHTEAVKAALFAAGAGKLGDYDHCSWQTLGSGQFRPLENSNAFLGEKGIIEQVPEHRVEMICTDECIEGAIEALKKAHPYEVPAYYAVQVRLS